MYLSPDHQLTIHICKATELPEPYPAKMLMLMGRDQPMDFELTAGPYFPVLTYQRIESRVIRRRPRRG
jgi:hypothetical protein